MKLIEDTDTFDELQVALLENLLKVIKSNIEELGLEKEKALDLLGNIGFSISCVFDGSAEMLHKGKPLIPLLSFALDDEGNKVVYSKNGSWMHEYVYGLVDEVCEDSPDATLNVSETEFNDIPEGDSFFFVIYITYSSGVQLEYTLASVFEIESNSDDLAEAYYNIIDPTGERIKIEAEKKPKDVSSLFSTIVSVKAIDQSNQKSYGLDISGFDSLSLSEINLSLTKQCKMFHEKKG